MGINLIQAIKEQFECEGQDIRSYAPLSLAYVGDAVYELVIRSMLLSRKDMQVHYHHEHATRYVSAAAQAKLMREILPLLTEEEEGYYRRGRNAKSFSVPKHAAITDYRIATGFEALCGYWYLSGQTKRLLSMVKTGVAYLEKKAEDND